MTFPWPAASWPDRPIPEVSILAVFLFRVSDRSAVAAITSGRKDVITRAPGYHLAALRKNARKKSSRGACHFCAAAHFGKDAKLFRPREIYAKAGEGPEVIVRLRLLRPSRHESRLARAWWHGLSMSARRNLQFGMLSFLHFAKWGQKRLPSGLMTAFSASIRGYRDQNSRSTLTYSSFEPSKVYNAATSLNDFVSK